ncbi:MAG: hypothetical protein IJX07_04955 [Bacillales bacterium]|nr:hypothetical protein [Bacillales bacterium]
MKTVDANANVFSESELKELDLISELKNEIMVSITEQTKLGEPASIILSGHPIIEIIVSVGFLKDVKVDGTMIQQIIKDSIEKVSKTENITISTESTIIKIEQ